MIYRNQDHGNEIGHYAQIIHPKWCCIDFDVWEMKGIGYFAKSVKWDIASGILEPNDLHSKSIDSSENGATITCV